jgi:hypothetical protein
MSTREKGNYFCGCDKVFLYYSSLKKHIKLKHNNISLEGTFQAKGIGR